jgi:hypothetical protein
MVTAVAAESVNAHQTLGSLTSEAEEGLVLATEVEAFEKQPTETAQAVNQA